MRLRIGQEEYRSRIEKVLGKLEERDADALVLFNSKRIAYLVGYHALATERPLAIIISKRGKISAFVPRLEVEAAESQTLIGEVQHYFEYPGNTPLMGLLAELLKGYERVIADSDGYPGIWGYEGPKLSELLDTAIEVDPKVVEEMWLTKSPAEIELIKESALWGNLAHTKLQEYTKIGASEIGVSLRASYEASREMLAALGSGYGGHSRGGVPAHAGFISGERTALPHAMSWNRKIKQGDVLITGASADIWGYVSELERTMIVGEPTPEQKRYFEIMLEAQTIGIERSGPDVPLANVDQAVADFLERQGLGEYLRHHTGHHLGFAPHEPPFIDRNSQGVMEPNQVYSIEPGIYITGKAGYRHSDTILITEDGVELITYYPRDLESLIITER